MDFVKELTKYLKKELESKNYSVNLYKNTEIKHFFGSEIKGNIAKVSFNPIELIKLKTSNIKKGSIEQSARYFAEHEYRHWESRFQIFNSPEFNIYSPVEKKLMLKDSHGHTYFPYNENNLRYLFTEFLIDTSLDDELKNPNNLFVQYNLQKLKEAVIALNFKNYKNELNDVVMIRGFTKNLKSELNNILFRALRLYGLNQVDLVEKISRQFEISSFLQIFNHTHDRLIEIYNSDLNIENIKADFIEIKEYLEEQDYIQLFSDR